MRVSGIICFSIALTLLFVSRVYTAGVATHLAVATRLRPFLPNDIKSNTHIGALLAGSFHPDCFYNCLGLHDTSEEAHWPPFLGYAVQYYNKKYGVLRETTSHDKNEQHSKDGQKLKSFLYGVFFHQVSDISWHSLYLKQGLLQMLAQVEFDGATGSAHSFLDMASDFLVISKLLKNSDLETGDSVLEYLSSEWDIPSDDLVEIYNFMGYETINKRNLEFCMLTGYSALKAEISSEKGLSSYCITQSPLLDSILDEYYLGGLNEMESTIQICLDNFNSWFESGDVDENPWQLCSVYHEHNFNPEPRSSLAVNTNNSTKLRVSSQSQDSSFITSYVTNSRFGSSILSTYINDELYLAIGAETEEISGSVYMVPLKNIMGGAGSDEVMPLKLQVDEISGYTNVMYPDRFGNKMVEWKLTDEPESSTIVVINKPGKSELMLYIEGKLVAIIRDFESDTAIGSPGIKEIGLSLYVDDIDQDGFNDLIIGSEFCDGKKDFQQGQVLVLSGRRLLKSLGGSNPYFSGLNQQLLQLNVIQLQELVVMEYMLPQIYHFDSQFEQFGKTISTTDELVFISVNAIGSVLVFNKFTGTFLHRIDHLGRVIDAEDEKERPSRLKSKETGLFGYNFILTGKLDDSQEWVMISAKAKSSESCVMCGSIYAYNVHGSMVEFVTEIVSDTTLNYDNSIVNLGENAIVSENIVYVSAENHDGKGVIFQINVEDLLEQKSKTSKSGKMTYLNEENILLNESSNQGFTKFGHSMQVFEFSGVKYMAVGMPYFGYNMIDIDLKLFGKIGIYKIE